MSKTFEYWLVENTGFSNGESWFAGLHRFPTKEAAIEYAAIRINAPLNGDTKWRVTKVKTEYEYFEVN